MLVYLIPLTLVMLIYYYFKIRVHKHSVNVLKESIEDGMMQPASLHPVINHNRCIGCRACVIACPESKNHVLGMINNKAVLINPAGCIGHGPCKDVCPVDAITLVFGTEERGIDIPEVAPDFETNVPGVFLAGEIVGMGLIHNAIRQGVKALMAIYEKVKQQHEHELDVLIVGAGPAGLAASLAAMEKQLSFKTIEQDSLGGVVAHYPRGKLVMTEPVYMPMIGDVYIEETTKEELLEFWHSVVEKTGLKINFNERMENVEPARNGFLVKTTKDTYDTKAILLAIGRQGTPRKLNVPGEELSKVTYRLIDAEQYKGKHVLVVGGGDSALEAAYSLSEEEGTTVTLSYRGAAFNRAKKKNRENIAAAVKRNTLQVYFNSQVKRIEPEYVVLENEAEQIEIVNDAVIICAGGVLPTGFLSDIGIKYETKYGVP